jgi:zinc protease
VYKVWNTPELGTIDDARLDLLSGVLASGKTSRLYKRLVYDDQTATAVNAFDDSREIASLFTIQVDVKKDGDPAKVEKAMDEELAKFLSEGPTPDELQRAKTDVFSGFTRGVERIGGFGGTSDVLAAGMIYAGTPDAYKTNLDIVRSATAAEIKDAGKRWLSDGVYILQIDPYPTGLKAEGAGANRKKMPEGGAAPAVVFPKVEKTTLSNGMKIQFARRESIPVVEFNLIFDAGYAADQGGIPGTASLAMAMIDEGTKTRSSLQISDEQQRLGANIGTGSNVDSSFVTLSAMNANLDASLDLFADVVLHPSFPEADFKRLQKQQIARIQREKAQPVGMGLRVLPKLLYGANHPYGLPFSGSGYEDGVAKLTRDELVKFHESWFKPDNATMIVVGNTTLAEIKPKLESLFKDWKKGNVPAKKMSNVAGKSATTIYILDKPGAAQSVILAGQLVPPVANPDEIAFKTMTQILGGSFIARLNMDLREEKHWSYGSYTFVPDARGQRPFIGYAPVQTDKTKESMVEVMKQLKGITGPIPVAAPELAVAQDAMTRTLPGQWETQGAVSGSIADLVVFGLPDDYYTTFPSKVRALKTGDVDSDAKKTLTPDKMVWVVAGDRAKIEAGIKELGWGDVKYLDPDGNPK